MSSASTPLPQGLRDAVEHLLSCWQEYQAAQDSLMEFPVRASPDVFDEIADVVNDLGVSEEAVDAIIDLLLD